MDIYSGNLYWPGTSPHYYLYPKLERSIRTGTVVVGAGLAGILCGYLLAKSGLDTVIVDAGDVGGGAASADSGLIQSVSDMLLSELIDRIGERSAVRLYAACRHAVEQLSIVAGGVGRDVGFKRRSSLRFASDMRDVSLLEREFRALRTYGFDVEYWSGADIAAHFPFTRSAGIVTHGDAEVNPYLLVHEAAAAGISAGLQVYEQTAVARHERSGTGHRLTTADGFAIEADHVVYATGIAPVHIRNGRMSTRLNRTYSLATRPQISLSNWHQRFILQDMSEHGIVLRTTSDGRILASGRRERSEEPLPADRAAREAQIAALVQSIRSLFPDSDPTVAHEWCAAAGESLDRLPYIGEDPDNDGVFYSLGCGGNGIVYAMLAAQLIRDRLVGDKHPVADLLRLGRPALASVR